MLWGKYKPSKNTAQRHNVLFRYPPQARKVRASDDFAEEASISMRLQSCWPQDENEQLTFYGTKNGPDPDLLEMSGINPFTDSQWKVWDAADKRQLLLQCPCVSEKTIENPEYELDATYKYQAVSINALSDELRLVITKLLGVK